ncbi:OPT oligopeptide transporter [Verticillium dahliae]
MMSRRDGTARSDSDDARRRLLPPVSEPSPGPRSPEGRRAKVPPQIHGHSFTFRGVAVGLAVGLVICFSNMYFGLQTGWVSTMTMPASLMGFGLFRSFARHLSFPFSPVENVLVQTVAGSMAIMPLGCGFVGVLPAMNYLLTPEEQGPITLEAWKLIVWSLGLCYFGVVFAVPLRRQVIIRERLRFPSGFSTAVLIGVLHGKDKPATSSEVDSPAAGGFASLVPPADDETDDASEDASSTTWVENVRLLAICFVVSGVYTLCTFFFPSIRNIPIFGTAIAQSWLWTLNPSPAYIGQGIIMGPETTLHMLLGALVGWGVLSPLAKSRGWAPGAVGDWETGSKGWILWTSLAIMLADAVVNLAHLIVRSLFSRLDTNKPSVTLRSSLRRVWSWAKGSPRQYSRRYSALQSEDYDDNDPLPGQNTPSESPGSGDGSRDRLIPVGEDVEDAPPDQQVGGKTVTVGLFASIVLCVVAVRIVFGNLVPLYANVAAVLLALVLSIMGVRALGETDLNPVSGISKLAQLFFAIIIPQSHKTSVLINLVAGAVSEAGALQAGELMQDLKTGHLLGAEPQAQFYGQIIGATAGAVVSAFVYRLYTAVYPIPGSLLQVPTAYVWIFTARLVTGEGLPNMAREWATGFSIVFAITTTIRAAVSPDKGWRPFIPGGIAVAVGMYNVPSFTLARALGGLLNWYWSSGRFGSGQGRSKTSLIVLASGFILGEGFLSVVNLILQTLSTPPSG